ncbi:MAG: glycosyltransferase family 2 protein, partial [Desulfobulbaceae bacterium]|nr:glycosyltransferase family 2 protein [Desulfobulbaceae bacterium]
MTFISWLAIPILGVVLMIALDLMRGNRTIRDLSSVPVIWGNLPRVSLIVAARNEARHIREALQSHLALDYPDYELIVVNDRSEDETGLILDDMAFHQPRLSVIHLDSLPPGWLGKNHALYLGAKQADGDLFLFTDADIVMRPSVLTRAVCLMRDQGLDHLTVSPSITMPTHVLQIFGASFVIFFAMFVRPWKVRDPKSSCHVGIGAFNLIRSDVYRSVGGHEVIRLRPDDDVKLGKIVKQGGYCSDFAFGKDLMSVEWYASVGEVIRGLEKNAFAGCDYRISLVLFGVAFLLVFAVWPYLAVVVCEGTSKIIYGA